MSRISREQIKRSRNLAGYVQRYHTWPTITKQTVAHHQWRVTTLLVEVFGPVRFEVIYYALWHDGGELFAGDTPFQVKVLIPNMREATRAAEDHGLSLIGIKLPELSGLELAQIKIADLLEMHEYGRMEMNLGNSFAEPVMHDTLNLARKVAADNGLNEALNAWIANGYKGGAE